MLKRILSHRMTGAAAFLLIFGGLLFVTLRDGKAVEKTKKGWLGVGVQELTPSLREAMKVGDRQGLLITNVIEDSPADKANLKDEDVIVEFDGKKVEKADDFVRMVRNTAPGKKVTVKFIRAGEEKKVEVTIAERKSSRQSYRHSYSWDDGRNIMIFGRPRLGVQVHELNKDLASYFKVEANSGVLVLEVNEDSPAEKAGLKAGDVIIKIDGEGVKDPDDLIKALDDYEEGEVATIEYVRQGKTEKAEVELEFVDGRGFQFIEPGRQRIRIHRFAPDNWREAEIRIPELEKHFEAARKAIEENTARLQKQLDRLPKEINREMLHSI
jgi:C-terminal processing protease CtpA/Prc